ncbi:unnamed protein product [Ectocarpus sp. 12 AP-2014]
MKCVFFAAVPQAKEGNWALVGIATGEKKGNARPPRQTRLRTTNRECASRAQQQTDTPTSFSQEPARVRLIKSTHEARRQKDRRALLEYCIITIRPTCASSPVACNTCSYAVCTYECHEEAYRHLHQSLLSMHVFSEATTVNAMYRSKDTNTHLVYFYRLPSYRGIPHAMQGLNVYTAPLLAPEALTNLHADL